MNDYAPVIDLLIEMFGVISPREMIAAIQITHLSFKVMLDERIRYGDCPIPPEKCLKKNGCWSPTCEECIDCHIKDVSEAVYKRWPDLFEE